MSDAEADDNRTTLASEDQKLGTIGPYRLLRELGRGGMGVVYEAAQSEPVARRVAVKILHHFLGEEALFRFEGEAQTLARMSHPYVASIFDAGRFEGRPYLVMEHVKGRPITGYCDEERLSLRKRLVLFLKICEGVQHAHQKAIVHRDIKPANVLVWESEGGPLPKVIDFGIAKHLQGSGEDPFSTQVGQPLGTPAYMSPEQAQGDPAGIDTRTDVYSLGVLLYELLTGCLPFASYPQQSGELKRQLRDSYPPSPSRRLSDQGLANSGAVARARRIDPRLLKSVLKGDLDWITMTAIAPGQGRSLRDAFGARCRH